METTGGSKNGLASSKTKSTGSGPNLPAQPSVPEPETTFEEEEPVDVEAEIERRRRRREELLAKSRGATPMLVQVLQSSEKSAQAHASPTITRGNTPMLSEDKTPQSGESLFPANS